MLFGAVAVVALKHSMAPSKEARRRQQHFNGKYQDLCRLFVLPKRNMPTRVDVVAEATQHEILNAVEQIETNLASQSSSLPTSQRQTEDDLPSPLFQDEVQRQEMQYLDRLLVEKRSSFVDDDGLQTSQSKGIASDHEKISGSDSNRSKVRFGPSSPMQIRQPNHSKIASILSPYDRRDDDECDTQQGTNNDGITGAQEQTNNASHLMNNNSCNQPKQKPVDSGKNTPNSYNQHTIGRKVHAKISNLIYWASKQQSKSTKFKHRYNHNQKTSKTSTPSRNKRRQLNNKLMQRAQRSSRRIVTKLVKLGRRCTKNLATVQNAIHDGVKKAMLHAHSMLEETGHAHRRGEGWPTTRSVDRGRVSSIVRVQGNRNNSGTNAFSHSSLIISESV